MSFFELNDFFEFFTFSHKKIFFVIKNIWDALSNIEKYLEKFKFKKSDIKIPANCFIDNPDKVFIGKNTTIEPNTYIKGPCIIGENCQIRANAYIRENVITGNGCIIGHATEIKNSILLNDASAAHFAYIGDSIIGNRVNIGAGVKLANFRLDKKNIRFYMDGKKIDTNLNKLGSIIADDCQIGCNSVLNPATFLKKNVKCLPSLNIGGYFLKNSLITKSTPFINKKSRLKDIKNELKTTLD
ncbi:MAG: Bifunctional protein GlmU [Candidatus Anoxychlamydiales bacterium]|nr:Bifunctional protein GlmU [Candidatus Anoxychlamydiales bacterium]